MSTPDFEHERWRGGVTAHLGQLQSSRVEDLERQVQLERRVIALELEMAKLLTRVGIYAGIGSLIGTLVLGVITRQLGGG